jgi:hypothetical protein
MTEDMSGNIEPMRDYLPDLVEIREQKGWDDYLAWCKRQENSAHE